MVYVSSYENALKKWIVNNGGFIHKNCGVDYLSYGYGLVAKENIEAGDALCCIPSKLCFMSSSTRSNSLHDISEIILAEKKVCDSFFKPFLDMLPENVSLPACYTDERLLDELSGTGIALDALLMRNKWRDDFKLTTDKSISEAQYIWSRATIQGRTYAIGKVVAFIPFIQLANHDDVLYTTTSSRNPLFPCFSNGISFPVDNIILRSESKYIKNQPIVTSYGDLSFQQKLLSFGFVDRNILNGFSITAVDIPDISSRSMSENSANKQIEIKTFHKPFVSSRSSREDPIKKEMSAAIRKVADICHCNREEASDTIRLFLYERLRSLRYDTTRSSAMMPSYSDISGSLKSTSKRKIEMSLSDCEVFEGDEDCIVVRKVEINAVNAILRELAC